MPGAFEEHERATPGDVEGAESREVTAAMGDKPVVGHSEELGFQPQHSQRHGKVVS